MRTNRPGRQRVRPLPTGSTLFTPRASPARQATERRSARVLLYLYQLPKWLPAAVAVLLLVVGLVVKGAGGAVALCVLAVLLAWLAALSWPRLTAGSRAGRVLGLVGLLVLAAVQASR